MSFKLEVVFSGLTLLCGSGFDGRVENCDDADPGADRLMVVNAEPTACSGPDTCVPEMLFKWGRLMYRDHLAVLRWDDGSAPSFPDLAPAQQPTIHDGAKILLRDLTAAAGEKCLDLVVEGGSTAGAAPTVALHGPSLHPNYEDPGLAANTVAAHATGPLPNPAGTAHVLDLDAVNPDLDARLLTPSLRTPKVVAEFRTDAGAWSVSTPRGAYRPPWQSPPPPPPPAPTAFGLIGPGEPSSSCAPYQGTPSLSKEAGLAENLVLARNAVTGVRLVTCSSRKTVFSLTGAPGDARRLEILNHALTPPPGSSAVNHVLWYYDLFDVAPDEVLDTICEPPLGITSIGGTWYCPKAR